MVIYNVTNVDTALNPYETFKAVNDLSGGLMCILILTAAYLIILITMKLAGAETKAAILVSSAIISLVATLMFFAELITGTVVIIPIIMLFISLFAYKFGGD